MQKKKNRNVNKPVDKIPSKLSIVTHHPNNNDRCVCCVDSSKRGKDNKEQNENWAEPRAPEKNIP